jgi:hypothetical protein
MLRETGLLMGVFTAHVPDSVFCICIPDAEVCTLLNEKLLFLENNYFNKCAHVTHVHFLDIHTFQYVE